jgi:hypothetical protein
MWEAIQNAYHLIVDGGAVRIDGDGWKVYRAGNIVRVDIEEK